MNPKKPVIILSGFLGSGKTTLLNQILTNPQNTRYAVLINEFGSIGLDQDLITSFDDFVKMDNGCLCCALNAELVETIKKLIKRDDYDAVILETTGIADPLGIGWTFLRPPFDEYFRLDSIITVVDALHFDDMKSKAEEPELQVKRADMVYLSKIDLVDEATLDKRQAQIAEINSHARLVLSSDDKALELLFDADNNTQTLKAPEEHTNHHDHYTSLSFDLTDKNLSLESLEDFLEELPPEVFRAKASFYDADKQTHFILHWVCGRCDFDEAKDYQGQLALVLIGKDFDKQKLEQDFLKLL